MSKPTVTRFKKILTVIDHTSGVRKRDDFHFEAHSRAY